MKKIPDKRNRTEAKAYEGFLQISDNDYYMIVLLLIFDNESKFQGKFEGRYT